MVEKIGIKNSGIEMFCNPLQAQELIIMPIWAFLKLANDELANPGSDGRQVIMLFNTARCGSTLLCQMFSRLPNTRYY